MKPQGEGFGMTGEGGGGGNKDLQVWDHGVVVATITFISHKHT